MITASKLTMSRRSTGRQHGLVRILLLQLVILPHQYLGLTAGPPELNSASFTLVNLTISLPDLRSLIDGDVGTSWTPGVNTTNVAAPFRQSSPVSKFVLRFGNNTYLRSLQVRLTGTDATWVVDINQTCSDTFYHWGNNNNDLRQCVSVDIGQPSLEVWTPPGVFWVVNKTNGALVWSMNFTRCDLEIHGDVGGLSGNSKLFSLTELEISTFNDDPSKHESCRCDPTGLASVAQPCNTTGTDTGRCLCRPQPSYPSSKSGGSCRPYIQPLRDFTPYYGPRSGGTLVQFNGSLLSNVYSIMIGNRYPCVPYGSSRVNDNVLQCTTTAANESDIGKPMPFHICWSTDTYTSCLITADEFTYRPEPTVVALSRVSSTASGGLSITINGTNFDSVYGYFDRPAVPQPSYMPFVIIHVDINIRQNRFYDYNETFSPNEAVPNRCLVRSNRQIVCKTPRLSGFIGEDVINSWKSLTTSVYLELHLGTGDEIFNNNTLDHSFMVYIDPTLDEFSPIVKDFNVHRGDTLMTISGRGLLEASGNDVFITKDDYTITVGGVACVINDATNNMISCMPPQQEPAASSSDKDGAHSVAVSLGYYHLTVGYLKYVGNRATAALRLQGLGVFIVFVPLVITVELLRK